jgi:DNA-binding XRE family transcriptional regulator
MITGLPAFAHAQTIQSDRPMLSLRRGGRECKYTEDALAEKLGVSQQTVNAWITDIRARQRTNRNSIILKLSRLGWTQEKISETMGINQQRISQITNNTSFGNIGNLLSQGHDMEYIAAHTLYYFTKPGASSVLCPPTSDL